MKLFVHTALFEFDEIAEMGRVSEKKFPDNIDMRRSVWIRMCWNYKNTTYDHNLKKLNKKMEMHLFCNHHIDKLNQTFNSSRTEFSFMPSFSSKTQVTMQSFVQLMI